MKHYSDSEKAAIIAEAGTAGVMKTLKKHRLSSNTYYSWKRANGNGAKPNDSALVQKITRLSEENRELRDALVDLVLRVRKS